MYLELQNGVALIANTQRSAKVQGIVQMRKRRWRPQHIRLSNDSQLKGPLYPYHK